MKRILLGSLLISIVLLLMACSISVDLTATPEPPTQTVAAAPLPTQTTQDPAPTSTAEEIITVYFTDQAKFAVGTMPYEVAVTRPLPAGVDPVRAVLDALFAGPTAEEAAQGLALFSSGFSGVREYTLENGIARIYLDGKCANNGAAYSIASVIAKNLEQFPQITAFKIYDENGDNEDPDSGMSSIPYCLEP